MTREFNLIDQPWISIQRLDGTPDEVSIRQAFAESAQIRFLAGEVPTQAFANLRLLIAVLYCAAEPGGRRDWLQLWQDGPPIDRLDAHLEEHRARFDLFDPVAPFYQVADLHTPSGKVDGLQKIIADVPDRFPYLTTRAGAGLSSITPAEAARWLVHAHAYDTSGVKSGAVGDPQVQAGKGYGIGPGWAGRLGGIVLHGEHLWETILLNLVPLGKFEQTDDDTAPWERPPDTAVRQDFSATAPRGPVHLLTLQSRRVRLIGDHDGVTGVVLAQGDKLSPQNRWTVESMTGWQHSKKQSVVHNTVVYMPRGHTFERALWRNTAALLPAIPGGNPPPKRSPKTIDWVAEVSAEMSDQKRVRLQAIAMAYGSNESTVAEIIDDTVDLSITLLGATSAHLAAVIDDAVRAAEVAVKQAGKLASNLVRAAGERGENPGGAAYSITVEDGYSRVDQPCRRWLASLNASSDRETAMATWERIVFELMSEMGRELISQAGPAGIVGRVVDGTFINVACAELWFLSGLRKALPRASQQVRDEHDHQLKERDDSSSRVGHAG